MNIAPASASNLLPGQPPHVMTQLDETLAAVAEVIAPVWPLKDYVAVNPYAGISHRTFKEARAFLRVFSDCETLMPVKHYAEQFQGGGFKLDDIQAALVELASSGLEIPWSAAEIVEFLTLGKLDGSRPDRPLAKRSGQRPIRTIAEYASARSTLNWTEVIVDEISKHCAAHYDLGQAIWASPYAGVSLYQAWRTVAEHDLNVELLGLSRFRKFVSQLPHTPEAAVVYLLQKLRVPQPLWTSFLLCQAFSVYGWSAWAKYQTSWTNNASLEKNDFVGLLAMRLAYDVALAEAKLIVVDWEALGTLEAATFRSPQIVDADDTTLRYTLLRASEIGYRNRMLSSLVDAPRHPNRSSETQQLAQLVFCIDVRSERIRRQLESQSASIETFGFAGFFAMAFEYVKLGETAGSSQLPVLLKPQFKVVEGLPRSTPARARQVIAQRSQINSWRKLWKGFQSSAVGCFSFVETTGLFGSWKLLRRSLGFASKSLDGQHDGLTKQEQTDLGPTLEGLPQQGIDEQRQADLAEATLRNIGLIDGFAKFVVFCGHACQTENNPLAAGLDCGACGGHSGEPNARLAALLLNQPYIRCSLAERGIEIPADTYFLAGLHNTTTDALEFFDVDGVPDGHQTELQTLLADCQQASENTRLERMPTLTCHSSEALVNRARDWSETRPEWGLAGNAAFIAAPRSLTKNINLDARCFLHSYDFAKDREGKVLETIMTAPMVVAHWINMQYYASTVDQQHFGSGNKTVHNVVGGFGILSGNSGDLMTGLPWQSLHDGGQHRHLPMRLQVVIAAPRGMIDRVISKHRAVADLLNGSWLHLLAIEGETMYRYSTDEHWERVELGSKTGGTEV